MLKINGKEINKKTLAKMIDGSLLNPFTTQQEVAELVDQCIEYDMNSCCVNPNFVKYVAERLKGTSVKTCAVIDYPFGTGTTEDKVAQAKQAINNGAEILDYVIDYGMLKSGDRDHLLNEIKACVAAAEGRETRFIIEVCYLTDEEVVAACQCVEQGGGNFVKSSTGRFGGPEMKIVKLMRDSVSDKVKVKIAGTGRFWTTAIALNCIAAGADIIGTRAGKQIIDELPLFESFAKNISVE